METDERPNKRTKVNHERDSEVPAAAAAATTDDVPMAAATDTATDTDAGAKTTDALLPTEIPKADATLGEKSNSNLNPLSGTSTSNAVTDTAMPSNTAGSPREQQPQLQETAQTTSTTTSSDGQPLSKNAQKRLRRQAEWDAKKADRKTWRKEKNQVKKERKKEARAAAGEEDPEVVKEKQRNRVRATQLPVTFVIDCDFDDKMRDNERISLAGQITRLYSDNKNAPFRAHLAVCSFNGKLRERFDTVLHKNYTHWKGTRFLDEDFVVASEKAKEWMNDEKRGGKLAGVFKEYAPTKPATSNPTANTEPNTEAKDETTSAEATTEANRDETETKPEATEKPDPRTQGEIIYLSSDSPHTLTTLKPYSTYIIGGLVDKNREKGICAQRAAEKGIKTARLPIGDYLEMASRKVLATNHVNEIMLRWLELGDWGEAFMKVIPKRKGGKLRGEKGDDEDGEDDEEEEYAEAEENGQDGEGNEEDEAEEANRNEAEIETLKAEVKEEVKEAQV